MCKTFYSICSKKKEELLYTVINRLNSFDAEEHIWTRSFPRAPPPPAAQWYAPRCMRSVQSTGGQSSSVPAAREPRSLRQTLPALQPPAQSEQRPAMKQTLSELLRMSRICRMLFATCLGSFILVIFYFQSMFQPGRTSLLSPLSLCVCV